MSEGINTLITKVRLLSGDIIPEVYCSYSGI